MRTPPTYRSASEPKPAPAQRDAPPSDRDGRDSRAFVDYLFKQFFQLPMSSVIIKRLGRDAAPALVAHFLALSAEDRRLRFGAALADAALADYVARIDFGADAVFGVHADDLALLGVAHIASGGAGAELGVSVLRRHRGHGVGSALLRRAGNWARNQFIGTLFMHCLVENRAIMHIAAKSGMRVVAESGEADAFLALAPTNPALIADELVQDRIALFDYALKSQVLAAQRLWRALAPPAAG